MATTERRVESISELTLDNRNIPQPSLLLKNGSNEPTTKHDGIETFAVQKPGDGVSSDTNDRSGASRVFPFEPCI